MLERPHDQNVSKNQVTSDKKPCFIDYIYIEGFHQVKDTESPYVVFEIVMEAEERTWRIERRFSQFETFWDEVRQWPELWLKVRKLGLRLPTRYLRRYSRESLALRAMSLQNDFLIPIVQNIGPTDHSFWLHPSVQFFFGIKGRRNLELRDRCTDIDWPGEVKKAEDLLEGLKELKKKEQNTKRDKIIEEQTRRLEEDLRRAIDALEGCTQKDVEREMKVATLKAQLAVTMQSSPKRSTSPLKTPEMQRTSLSGSPRKHGMLPLRSTDMTQEERLFRMQMENTRIEDDFEKLSKVVRRTKQIGENINKEIEEGNDDLKRLGERVKETQTRVERNTERAKQL